MYRETLDDTPLHVKDAALPGPSEAAGLALSSGPPQSHATRANTSKLQSIWKAFCALDVPPSRYALGSLRQVGTSYVDEAESWTAMEAASTSYCSRCLTLH